MMVGAGIHALTTYEDVRMSPSKRHSILRFWGTDHKPSIVSKIVHPEQLEGSEVDHEEWNNKRE
jgi:hypothetical protein